MKKKTPIICKEHFAIFNGTKELKEFICDNVCSEYEEEELDIE